MGQAAQRRVVGIGGIDCSGDHRGLFRAGRSQQDLQPVAQEPAVGRRVGQCQRIEAGGMARRDPAVTSVNGPNEQFGPAVLVENDRARRKLLRLGGQEVHHHGLARTRRADDGKVAEIAGVEIEEERGRAGRLQQGHRLAPMVAFGLAQSKAVKRTETRHVRARNQRAADNEAFVARKLRPEPRFEVDVFAHGHRPGVCQRGRTTGDGVVQAGQAVGPDQDG